MKRLFERVMPKKHPPAFLIVASLISGALLTGRFVRIARRL